MPRLLCGLGLAILAAAAVLLLAGEGGAVPAEKVDLVFLPAVQGGALLFVGGLVLALLSPFGKMLRQGRCVRCGTRIEKSQTYCHNHLKVAVQEYQDEVRRGR